MMKGWKTWAAGLSSIATGVGLLLKGALSCLDPSAGCDGGALTEGMALVSFGLGVIGIGHKVEKAGS